MNACTMHVYLSSLNFTTIVTVTQNFCLIRNLTSLQVKGSQYIGNTTMEVVTLLYMNNKSNPTPLAKTSLHSGTSSELA